MPKTKLKAALERFLSGNDTQADHQLVRQSLLQGTIIFSEIGSIDFEGVSKDVVITETQNSIKVKVSTETFERIREELFPQPNGILPPFPNLLFVGRNNAMSDVKKLLGVNLETGSGSRLAVIRGTPGVGKTTLVNFLSRDPEITKTYPDGILWTSLNKKPQLLNIISSWGRALGRDDFLKIVTLNDAIISLASLLQTKRMLLIVDDVWDAGHGAFFLQVQSANTGLLFTTRLQMVSQQLATDNLVYRLPELKEDDAISLMQVLAPEVVEEHTDDCLQLVRDLECLPLAIHVAARLLRSESKLGWGVHELIKDIREGAAIIQAEAPADRVENGSIPTVQALLKKSTDMLDEQTRECFAYLGSFVPKPATFDLWAMQQVWQVVNAKPIARKLVDYGLLEPTNDGRFQMHAILVAHAKSLYSN